jgi:hypothetical protein
MSYPIRYRLVNKETNQVVKYKDDNKTVVGMIFPNGNPCIYTKDKESYYFTDSVDAVSCSDYYLEVALEKDDNGNWIYKRVGY